MLDFEELKDNISTFIREKPLLARITALLLIFFLLALIIIFIQSSKPKAKEYKKTDIVLNEKPLAPAGPEVEKDYYMSRSTQETWSKAEIEEYFTEPDSSLLKELENSNDKIIDEILGAAP